MQGYIIQQKKLRIEENIGFYGIWRYLSWVRTGIFGGSADTDEGITMGLYLDALWKDTYTYICPDCRELRDYLEMCRSRGLDLRILFVQSEDSSDEPSAGRFLGYDVICGYDFFSGIYDDLFSNIPEPMKKDYARLNKHGLFDNYPDAAEFRQNMDTCIAMGYDVEPSDDFEIVKVYETDGVETYVYNK